MTQNLGKAISILMKPHNRDAAIVDDIYAMGAPSECYALAKVSGNEYRLARRHACKVAGVKSMRLLRKAIRARIGNDAPIYRRYGFVPY